MLYTIIIISCFVLHTATLPAVDRLGTESISRELLSFNRAGKNVDKDMEFIKSQNAHKTSRQKRSIWTKFMNNVAEVLKTFHINPLLVESTINVENVGHNSKTKLREIFTSKNIMLSEDTKNKDNLPPWSSNLNLREKKHTKYNNRHKPNTETKNIIKDIGKVDESRENKLYDTTGSKNIRSMKSTENETMAPTWSGCNHHYDDFLSDIKTHKFVYHSHFSSENFMEELCSTKPELKDTSESKNTVLSRKTENGKKSPPWSSNFQSHEEEINKYRSPQNTRTKTKDLKRSIKKMDNIDENNKFQNTSKSKTTILSKETEYGENAPHWSSSLQSHEEKNSKYEKPQIPKTESTDFGEKFNNFDDIIQKEFGDTFESKNTVPSIDTVNEHTFPSWSGCIDPYDEETLQINTPKILYAEPENVDKDIDSVDENTKNELYETSESKYVVSTKSTLNEVKLTKTGNKLKNDGSTFVLWSAPKDLMKKMDNVDENIDNEFHDTSESKSIVSEDLKNGNTLEPWWSKLYSTEKIIFEKYTSPVPRTEDKNFETEMDSFNEKKNSKYKKAQIPKTESTDFGKKFNNFDDIIQKEFGDTFESKMPSIDTINEHTFPSWTSKILYTESENVIKETDSVDENKKTELRETSVPSKVLENEGKLTKDEKNLENDNKSKVLKEENDLIANFDRKFNIDTSEENGKKVIKGKEKLKIINSLHISRDVVVKCINEMDDIITINENASLAESKLTFYILKNRGELKKQKLFKLVALGTNNDESEKILSIVLKKGPHLKKYVLDALAHLRKQREELKLRTINLSRKIANKLHNKRMICINDVLKSIIKLNDEWLDHKTGPDLKKTVIN